MTNEQISNNEIYEAVKEKLFQVFEQRLTAAQWSKLQHFCNEILPEASKDKKDDLVAFLDELMANDQRLLWFAFCETYRSNPKVFMAIHSRFSPEVVKYTTSNRFREENEEMMLVKIVQETVQPLLTKRHLRFDFNAKLIVNRALEEHYDAKLAKSS